MAGLRSEHHVIDRRTRQTLVWCYIGDEDNVEKIADILSAKDQREAAHELREMARLDRRRTNPQHSENHCFFGTNSAQLRTSR